MTLFQRTRTALYVGAAATALSISNSVPVYAQLAGELADLEMDTITVVATRREESLQEVPVAVSVLGDEAIETLKPRDLSGFSGLAPNVHIGQAGATPGGSAIFIRGLGYQDVEKTQNPPVGVMIDGIVLGTSTGQLIDAFDVEQIEVSRGPQGIFFGKNTTGGAINVRRTRPTREFGARTSLGYGSHNEVTAKGIFNAPLGQHGGLKIGATYNQNDGFLENVFTGEDTGGQEYWAITAAVDFDFTDWARIALTYDHMDLDADGTPVQFGNPVAAQALGLAAIPGFNAETSSPTGLLPRQVSNDFTDASGLEIDLINATLTFDTPIGELVSVTGYLDQSDFQDQDFDGTCTVSPGCPSAVGNPLAPLLHTERPQTYEQFTQEVRLAGNTFDGRIDYLGGLYYYDHEVFAQQVTNGAVFQTSGENNDSFSVFGNIDFAVTDTVTVSGGARYIDESKDFFTGFELGAFGGATLIAPITDDVEFSDTITRFAVDWQATRDHLLYVSRAEGFRSGGISIRGTLSEQVEGQANCLPDNGNANPTEVLCPENNFLQYDPENVATWELGAKNTFFDSQLTLNAALFQTKIEGLQTVAIVVTPGYGPGTNTYINNLPEAEVQGVEVDFELRPANLDGFTLSGVFGFQDGEVTDGRIPAVRAASPFGTPFPPGSPDADFTGTQEGLGRIADFNFNIAGTYGVPVGPGILTLNSSYNYIDDHSLGQGFGLQDIEDGYGLLNAYVGYEWDGYSVSFTGRNLTDEDYRIGSLPAVAFQRWGDDLNWLVELQAEF